MKLLCLALFVFACAAGAEAAVTNVTAWAPLFKGVDVSYARIFGNNSGPSEKTEAINCLRFDLSDPDIRIFTTPHCTNGCGGDTASENTSHFLETFGVQVAVNCNFFGPADPPLGSSEDIFGLAVSGGNTVSPAEDSLYSVAMLFTSNNVATFIGHNWPPVSTAGIATGITGNYVLLDHGANTGINDTTDLDPRTAVGISADNRYLYFMTVDGRQGISWGVNPPWSDGFDFYEAGDWLARFGAFNGMNVDGGGSTTMCMADCHGASIRLNRSSYVQQIGRERNIGHNFGIYAKSAILNLSVTPGVNSAIVIWDTATPSNTQVEFGNTNAPFGNVVYTNSTPLDSRFVRHHIATVGGLTPGAKYYIRPRSFNGEITNTLTCTLATTTSVASTMVMNMTNLWKYTTNNLDGVNWKTLAYDDSGWFGPSNACFHIENSTSGGVSFAPRNTLLPPGFVVPIFRTYYFRTPFSFSGNTAGLTLTFSNYIDDGAIFYLNGTELNRIRVPAAPSLVLFSTFAIGTPCAGTPFSGDAASICPDLFTVGPSALVQGSNMLAVEVHNVSGGSTSQDIFFGSSLFVNTPSQSVPQLFIYAEGGVYTVYWNGQGYTLQQSSDLSSPANWTDVPGPVTASPYVVAPQPQLFYRLRN